VDNQGEGRRGHSTLGVGLRLPRAPSARQVHPEMWLSAGSSVAPELCLRGVLERHWNQEAVLSLAGGRRETQLP
jgi:hypothetical protein